MPDFHFLDFQARTFSEVGFQFFFLAMLGVFDAVVKDYLRRCRRLQQLRAIKDPNDNHRKQVNHDEFGIARRECHAVDDAEAHHHEKVGHLTDFDGLRSITYHAEDGKETQGVGDVHFHVLHQRDDKEDNHGEHQEGEIIVLAVGFLVIKEMDDDPADEEVESETNQHRP